MWTTSRRRRKRHRNNRPDRNKERMEKQMVSWVWLVVGILFSGCFGFTVGMIWDKKDWKQYQKMEMEREKKRDALERGQW